MKECSSCHRCLDDHYPVCPDDGAPLEPIFEGSCTLDGRYRLVRRLGKGAVGHVYLARHLTLKRTAAIKVLAPSRAADPSFAARFEREAEALGRLRHPAVVEILDFGVEAGRRIPYLVMEYLEGVSLTERLRAGGALDTASALPLFDAIADALDHAHAAGILHRDLKPANVFLIGEGADPPRVKVLDFGLARFFSDAEETLASIDSTGEDGEADPGSDELTLSGAWLGTPGFVAPEVFCAEPPTTAVDVYAFGALVYATLVGHPPFQGTPAQVARETLERPPARPSLLRPGLASGLDGPILAALAKNPALRPPTARSMVAGLRAVHRRSRWWRAAPARLACALLLGLAAMVGTSVFETPASGFENRLVDLRFHLAPRRAPHQPLLLLLIDDPTLEDDSTPLSDRADEMGTLLARTLEEGALGVGLDLLLPDAWSRSAPFSDLVLRYSERLVLAAFAPPDGAVIGPGVISGLTAAALGPERSRELFGYANLRKDPDGVVRRARKRHRDVRGQLRPSLAFKMAHILLRQTEQTEQTEPTGKRAPKGGSTPTEEAFWIDFTLDWQQMETISWKDLGRILEEEPERVRGRLVVVGMTYTGAGDGPHRVPHPRGLPGEIPGPMIQAVAVHTLLDGVPVRRMPGRRMPVRPASRLPALAAAGLGTLVAGLALLAGRRAAALASAAGILGWMAAAMAGFVYGGWLLPVAPFVLTLALILMLATVLRRFLPPP